MPPPPPAEWSEFHPPPFIYAVGASKGRTRPQKSEAQLFEHLNNSVSYFQVTSGETFLH